MTGCLPDDISCQERFAFSALFPGGFAATPSNAVGLSKDRLDSIVNLPSDEVEKFDASVHVRAQLKSLESGVPMNGSMPGSKQEEASDYDVVFSHIDSKLKDYFYSEQSIGRTWDNVTNKNPTVYLSVDDAALKTRLIALLESNADTFPLNLVYVNSTNVLHTKHAKMSGDVDQALVDVVFDWYDQFA
jgi:hypothetical protein